MTENLPWLILPLALFTAAAVIAHLVLASRALRDTRMELRDELRMSREEDRRTAKELREELLGGQKSAADTLVQTIETIGNWQRAQFEDISSRLKELANTNRDALDNVRQTLDSRLERLQENNNKALNDIRSTVDEKLQEALDKRLEEKFKLVSDWLAEVHKGLGEMRIIAKGVGDLQRVLTNVKARGTWAEVQLGAILEQILTPDQYDKNVHVKPDSAELVEYAIRLPGPKDDPRECVWLPIDSKFPQEDYVHLQEAADRADADAVRVASEALTRTVRAAAKVIHDKYVSPPNTTDFGIMFLPTEGLYAEVLRQPALVEELHQQYRVVAAGPTTLAAILSSLRMGFQTLAIEQQAVEVWRVLGAVKTEFGKFRGVLDRVKRQLEAASRTIDETGVRTRAMERKLRTVEQLPEAAASTILALRQADQGAQEEEVPVEEGAPDTKQD